ncbi:MAG TPA: SDR family NAD(P)-dependent oxidoreductase [Candidatus Rubrimentiphilum sp.]|nr:SDR family NAD(P)-dependent oxidoreductase [Candidatus Rubrimentiphilum sp.]
MNNEVASRLFSPEDQTGFANLSGDFNPIHLDPVVARRSQAGAPIVHGVHAVLWALEELVRRHILVQPIATIEAQFRNVIYVTAPVSLYLARSNGTAVRAEVWTDSLCAVVLNVALGEAKLEHPCAYPETLPKIETGPVEHAFPEVSRALGRERAASIAQLSELVGMVRPGLYSMLGGFTVHITAESLGRLSFATCKYDERFRMMEIAVSGPGITGTVTALERRSPVDQPAFDRVRKLVAADEFAGSNALIVGGSRGLGAVTAKILAAGGARVIVTYVAGESDARELCAEIGEARCRAIRYNVLDEADPQLAAIDLPIDQLYYFATPHIGRQSRAEFQRYYVDGFVALCGALRSRGNRGLDAFYPSTQAIEAPVSGMANYAAAKAAGEESCKSIADANPGLRVISRRLPRILTDLTASLLQPQVADAVQTMLPIIREMYDSGGPAPSQE